MPTVVIIAGPNGAGKTTSANEYLSADERRFEVIETTLASLTYAQKIPAWRQRGYVVSLAYLRLGSISESMARVRGRVSRGGHDIPEDAIRRRFGKSLSYLETIYKPIVDEWYIWESRDGRFALTDSWDGRHASRT